MQNEPSHLTSSILTELEELNTNITSDVSERAKAQKLLNNLLKALLDENYDLVGQLLVKGNLLITSVYPQTKLTLQKVQIDVNRRLDEQLRQTGSQLEEYCRSENIPLKSSGTKYVVDYFIDVEIDRQKGRTRIGNLSLSTLKWTKIKECLDLERSRLWKRDFNPVAFRDKLLQAYKQLGITSPGAIDWISLEEIYQILKRETEIEKPEWKKGGRLSAYYKDEFSADLSLLWKAQASRLFDFPYIELSAIRDPRRAYKVVQPDNNIGFFGFLRPRGGK